jgi:hypothetical protein
MVRTASYTMAWPMVCPPAAAFLRVTPTTAAMLALAAWSPAPSLARMRSRRSWVGGGVGWGGGGGWGGVGGGEEASWWAHVAAAYRWAGSLGSLARVPTAA